MISELKNLTIIRKNGTIPSVPFLAIKEKVLGKISENSFIKTKKAERDQLKKEVNSIISNLKQSLSSLIFLFHQLRKDSPPVYSNSFFEDTEP